MATFDQLLDRFRAMPQEERVEAVKQHLDLLMQVSPMLVVALGVDPFTKPKPKPRGRARARRRSFEKRLEVLERQMRGMRKRVNQMVRQVAKVLRDPVPSPEPIALLPSAREQVGERSLTAAERMARAFDRLQLQEAS